jgi:hypothetical protein
MVAVGMEGDLVASLGDLRDELGLRLESVPTTLYVAVTPYRSSSCRRSSITARQARGSALLPRSCSTSWYSVAM